SAATTPPTRRPPSGAAAAAATWIAVIPFTSGATDEDSRTLADGLAEDITAGLARFPYLSVVAEHSARQHKGTTADVRHIGKVLGARYVLDGGIRRGGASIRITARLVDAESGAQLWSETYTRELPQGNPLAVQDDVTDRVVATVADVHGVLMRTASVNVRAVPLDQRWSVSRPTRPRGPIWRFCTVSKCFSASTRSQTPSRGCDARPIEPPQSTARTRALGTRSQMPRSSSATPPRFVPRPTARSISTRFAAGRWERSGSCARSPVIRQRVPGSSPEPSRSTHGIRAGFTSHS